MKFKENENGPEDEERRVVEINEKLSMGDSAFDQEA